MTKLKIRAIGLGLLLFLTGLAPLTYWLAENHLRNEALMEASGRIGERVGRLEDWLMNREIRFREFSHFFDYADFEKTKTQRTMNPYLRRLSSQFYKTYFASLEGVFYSSDSWIPSSDYDPRERSWFKEAVEAGSVVYVSPYVDADTMEYVVSFSVPVYQGRNLKGVVGVDLPTYAIDTLLIDAEVTYLMSDEAGFVMASALPVAKRQALSEQIDKPILHVLDRQAHYYDATSGTFYLREEIIDTGWSLYAMIESADLNTDYASGKRLLLLSIAFVYMVLSAGIYLLMRYALGRTDALKACRDQRDRLQADHEKERINKRNTAAFLSRLADDLDTQRRQFIRLIDEDPIDRDRFTEMFGLFSNRIEMLRDLHQMDLDRMPEFNRRCVLHDLAEDLKKWLLLNYHLREDQVANHIAPDVVAILDDYLVRRFFLHFTQRLFLGGSVSSISLQMEHHMIKIRFTLEGPPMDLAEETSYEESLGVKVLYEERLNAIDVRIPVLYQDWRKIETDGEVDSDQKRSLAERVTLISEDEQMVLLLESLFRRLQIRLNWSDHPREEDAILLVDERLEDRLKPEDRDKFVIVLRERDRQGSDELVLTKPYTYQKIVDLLALYNQAKTLEESE